jgi:hypothetical protein
MVPEGDEKSYKTMTRKRKRRGEKLGMKEGEKKRRKEQSRFNFLTAV